MLRPFQDKDLAGIQAIGSSIVGWWHERLPTIHLVEEDSTGKVVAHLQAADLGGRRQGEVSMILRVAEGHWESDVPTRLLSSAGVFCQERRASKLTASYLSTEPEKEAFLLANGFQPFERYMPLTLNLTTFDPDRFADLKPEATVFTYAEAGDSLENRRRLYDTEMAAKATQPFREVGKFEPQEFDLWQSELADTSHDEIFLASIDGLWVGLVRGLTWPFAGVRPEFRGRGIATALKVRALTVAKQRGLTVVETENHEDNLAMRRVNQKLGFVPGPVETNCVRRF